MLLKERVAASPDHHVRNCRPSYSNGPEQPSTLRSQSETSGQLRRKNLLEREVVLPVSLRTAEAAEIRFCDPSAPENLET